MADSGVYADLEIRIYAKHDQGYPVDLTLNSEQEFPTGPPGYLDSTFLPWTPSGAPAEDGQRLFEWLFGDDRLKTAWAEVRGQYPQRRVRLRLDATAPELHAIPWELLREAEDGIPILDVAGTVATPFSRYLAGKWQQARAGNVEMAVEAFARAAALNPNLTPDDPETEAKKLETEAKKATAPHLVSQGADLARDGNVEEAVASYNQALEFDPNLAISAGNWNNLCWFGSLWNQAALVESACEAAVALDRENGNIRDSRGVNRALLGDFAGAIEDFEAFVAQGGDSDGRRAAWIEALQAGENPFNEATLESLR